MKKSRILVLDSGIGGMSVLIELIKLMPNEHYVYFGDNKNAPYGIKTDLELNTILRKNLCLIRRVKPKVIVIACNTLSVDYKAYIERESGVKCIGVFPPIKKEYKKRTLLIATDRTCKKYSDKKNFTVLPLIGLAEDIENNAFSLSNLELKNHLPKEFFEKKNYQRFNTVILGCTHYFFIKNKISIHFCPQKIISGNKIAALKCYKTLKNNKTLENYRHFSICFIGSGKKKNKLFYKKVVKNLI